MLLQPSDPETLLIYGEHACGKTTAWLSIADCLRSMGNDHVRFYVADTDRAVGKNIQHFPELQASGMVVREVCQGFEDVSEVTDKWAKIVTPHDWIIVDKACDAWDDAATHWCESRLKCDPVDLELEYRTQDVGKFKGGSALLQFYGSGINPMWKKWLKRILYAGCNVVFVCSEADLQTDEKNPNREKKNDVVKQFIQTKKRPAIQKTTPFKFDTILHFKQPFIRMFRVTTVRERGVREWYQNEPVAELGFGNQYILGNAKWEII